LKVNSFTSQLEFKNFIVFTDDFSPIIVVNVMVQIKGVSGSLITVEGWKRPPIGH
jgi:hypothetical protein